MKKLFVSLLLCAFLLSLSGCSRPDSLCLDLSQGYGQHLRLIHLNASNSENRERMEAFRTIFQDAKPLDKPLSMFAYYPDYLLEITENGETVSAIVDLNGDFVDFYYTVSGEENIALYRSNVSAQELKELVHRN